MTAGQAIRAGLSDTRRAAWTVFLFFACNLLLAATVAAPMYSALRDHLGKSATAELLARGFSHEWLTEFQIAYEGFLNGFSIAIVYAGVLFLLLNTALSAGAFEVFLRGEGAGLHAFGRGMGKYFGRFFRLAAAASLIYFVLFSVLLGPLDRGVDWLFRDATHERWHFCLDWLRWGLLLLGSAFVSLTVQYAKADIVRHDHPSSLAALGHALGFVLAHLRRVLAIYLGFAVLSALAILAYAAFARYFPQSSVLTVFLWFVVAQALLWLRWMLRLALWGAASAYLGAHAPGPVTTPEPITEPLV